MPSTKEEYAVISKSKFFGKFLGDHNLPIQIYPTFFQILDLAVLKAKRHAT